MRILLVTSFFPPTHTAGTEKRTFGYAKTLLERGHQVQIVCAGIWDEGERYWNGYTDDVYLQIPVRRIHVNWNLAPDPNRYLYCNPVVEENLRQWLKQWKPDLVHVTSCLTLSASAIQAVQDSDIPLVVTLTDFWFTCPRVNLLKGDGSLCDNKASAWDCLKCKMWDSGVHRRVISILPESVSETILMLASKSFHLNRLRGLRGLALNMEERKAYLSRMLQSADCVTAPSAALAGIIQLAHPSQAIQVVYSGHDLSWIKSMPVKKHSKVLRIAYIGQLIEMKGVHTLLSAFCSANIASQAALTIFGDPNKDPVYFRRLEEIADGGNVFVGFKGAFSHEKLGEILSEIDVLVVPSIWHENNPRVIQEAYASGTPVIAAKVAGISEFVQHEVSGLLFERGEIKGLAEQLKRLIEEPRLLERLRAGIPKVRTIDDEVIELEGIYSQLLHDRKMKEV
jgi:glycosyltransferase involved in cell wall biosynthesis